MWKLRAIIAIAALDSRNARLRPGQNRGPAPKGENHPLSGRTPAMPAIGVELLRPADRAQTNQTGGRVQHRAGGNVRVTDRSVRDRLQWKDGSDGLQAHRLAQHRL